MVVGRLLCPRGCAFDNAKSREGRRRSDTCERLKQLRNLPKAFGMQMTCSLGVASKSFGLSIS